MRVAGRVDARNAFASEALPTSRALGRSHVGRLRKDGLSHAVSRMCTSHNVGAKKAREEGHLIARASNSLQGMDQELDDQLSKRPLELDPVGYFIIQVDHSKGYIIVEFYGNLINDQGMLTALCIDASLLCL